MNELGYFVAWGLFLFAAVELVHGAIHSKKGRDQ